MMVNDRSNIKCIINFEDSSLRLLENACIQARIGIGEGKNQLIFEDNRLMNVKQLIKSKKDIKVGNLTVKLLGHRCEIINTYTFTEVELVPLQVMSSNACSNDPVSYLVDIVYKTKESVIDW